jgi:hypothetical protein
MTTSLAYLSWTLGFGAWMGILGALAYHMTYRSTGRYTPFVHALLLTSPLVGSILFAAAVLSVQICIRTVVATVVHMFRMDVLTSLMCTLTIGGLVLGIWVQLVDMTHEKTPAESAQDSPCTSSASEGEDDSEDEQEDVGSDSGIVADDEVCTSSSGTTEDTTTAGSSDQFDTISE